MNAERELAGEKLFVNARNSTSGTLKLQDPKNRCDAAAQHVFIFPPLRGCGR